MLLNRINHPMTIYKDCTLGEVMTVSIASLIALTILLSLCSKLLLGYAWPGYLIASALFFFVTKLLLSKLQKLKYGKPYGYYQHLLIKKLSESGIIPSRYLIREGRWSVRRYLT